MLSQVFTDIYLTQKWFDICGSGSTPEYTAQLIPKLQDIIDRHQVKTLLDAPCGLYRWIAGVAVDHYIGADIVEQIIAQNAAVAPDKDFLLLDITHNALPPADLWLCRACLFHLSSANIQRALDNFIGSDIPFALFTTNDGDNVEGENGGWRPVNLERPPFNWPPPLEKFDDGSLLKMGLWSWHQF